MNESEWSEWKEWMRANRRERLYRKVFGRNHPSVVDRRLFVSALMQREAVSAARERG